jgi:hypothetical protein
VGGAQSSSENWLESEDFNAWALSRPRTTPRRLARTRQPTTNRGGSRTLTRKSTPWSAVWRLDLDGANRPTPWTGSQSAPPWSTEKTNRTTNAAHLRLIPIYFNLRCVLFFAHEAPWQAIGPGGNCVGDLDCQVNASAGPRLRREVPQASAAGHLSMEFLTTSKHLTFRQQFHPIRNVRVRGHQFAFLRGEIR